MSTSMPASEAPLEFETNGREAILRCPCCLEAYVHVDDVYMSGRPREDGDYVHVHVDNHGRVTQGHEAKPPLAPEAGRRHSIGLTGTCESCGDRFAIVFKQHKGQTEVYTLAQEWSPIN